jgi:hypothetical protein
MRSFWMLKREESLHTLATGMCNRIFTRTLGLHFNGSIQITIPFPSKPCLHSPSPHCACNKVRCVLRHLTTTVVILALNNDALSIVRLCRVAGRDEWISIWPRYTTDLDIPRLWSCPPVPIHMFYAVQIYILHTFVRRYLYSTYICPSITTILHFQ